MSDLRAARERAGLTLEQVFERTRIPVKWLDALERGDLVAFPPGPFLSGYTKQYRAFLGLPAAAAVVAPVAAPVEPSQTSPPAERAAPAHAGGSRPLSRKGAEPPDEPDPVGQVHRHDDNTITLTSPRARVRRAGRMAAIGAAVAFLALGGLAVARRTGLDVTEGVDIPPDQVLLVTSASGVHITVEADGRELFDHALTPGKQMKFAAHDRLAVELDALEGVTLVYNGRTLKPLGAQSRARRLVFVDDHGG
ncbi:hypothetical protein LBMAG42_30020 [Deltaproteobacteria bacterium]|nr:hypothetical protein LBMAG42_30020 [Deltaproteobacteria bacterium]